MTIKVWVMVNDEEIVGDEVVFPALPPIGAELRIQDREGRKRSLTVREIEMFGIKATAYTKVAQLGGQSEINIHCDDQFLPKS
jgi:hypothetical protein